MNICILSADYQPQYLGGIKRVTTILGEEWIKNGHNCYYVTLCISSIRPQTIKTIPQFFLPKPEELKDTNNEEFMIHFIHEHQIDILLNPHVSERDLTNLAIKAQKTTGIILVCALHISPTHVYDITKASFFISYHLEKNVKKWLFSALLWCRFHLYKGKEIQYKERQWIEKVVQSSNHFVVLSERFLHHFKDIHNISVINNPIDPEISNLPLENKQKNVVWCGRLDIVGTKRVDRILRIWRKINRTHNDWKLLLLGSGDTDNIKRMVRRHHIKNIEVKGFCNPYDYNHHAAIVAMTSTTEGWGMILTEGQSFGCAPIAFDSYESIHDIIQHEKTGILVNPFDLNEYARQLERLMDDNAYRNRIAKEASISVKRFKAESIAKQWERLFLDLLSPLKNS